MKNVKGTYVLEIPNNPNGLDFIEQFRRYKRNGYRLRLRGRGSRVGCTTYVRDLPLKEAERFVGYIDKLTPIKTMTQESPLDKREEWMQNTINSLHEIVGNLKDERNKMKDESREKVKEFQEKIENLQDSIREQNLQYNRLDRQLNEENKKLNEENEKLRNTIVYLANELSRRK
jgi:uncharacterized protein YukE